MEEQKTGIYAAINKVMAGVGAIGKDRRNEQGSGYNFRGIDDCYFALHAVLAEHGVFTVPRCLSRVETLYSSKTGTAMIRVVLSTEYDFFHTDGSKITVGPIYSEGNDSSDKSTNKALSVAHKYALLQVFCIPTVKTNNYAPASKDRTVPVQTKAPTKPGDELAAKTLAGNWKLPEDKGPSLCKGLTIKEIKKEMAYDYLSFMKSNMKTLKGWPKEFETNLNTYWGQ
jgi:hypothetical protein